MGIVYGAICADSPADVDAFHPGGPFRPMPKEDPHQRVARLEKAILDRAIKADRPDSLAVQLIVARAQITG